MQETYITLDEAARFEGVEYETIKKRVQRSPAQYKTRTEAREGGGKELVLLSTASLSQKGRRAYRAHIRALAEPEGMEAEPPWYVTADRDGYIDGHKKQFYRAAALAAEIQDFLNYTGTDRTGYAEELAGRLGVSLGTLYRYGQSVMEANAWAMRMEQTDGHARDYFRTLALCRKPREKATFPSLTTEQKAILENIWFDRDFSANRPTMELLYEAFEEQGRARGWDSLPSVKTVQRYINHLMSQPGAHSARCLGAKGLRAWKNEMQIKGKRTTHTLKVMEYVVADAHTFDLWVEYTTPNGKKKAIRPVLVAWEDMRSRRILGAVVCEHSNTQTVKESFVKMCYEAGCVPAHVHMDNGKDFANRETLGQDRSIRGMEEMDAEIKGFYLAMGARKWSRSLPFQPWDKLIERAFRTFCLRYSKKFVSYTGTLTGSKTSDKVNKPIQRMLERGELLTLEEFHDLLEQFLHQKYDLRKHRGLKEAGEQWPTPRAVWDNAERWEQAVPPREYAAMLLMKPDTARVSQQGITKFGTLYTAPELAYYVGRKVGVRWDVGDVRRLYVYDTADGRKVCEAYAAELLEFGDRVSQRALEELHREKNRQLKETRELLESYRTPPELRAETGTPDTVGKLNLMIGHAPTEKVISLPVDKEFRGEAEGQRKRQQKDNKFLSEQGGTALDRLRAIGE